MLLKYISPSPKLCQLPQLYHHVLGLGWLQLRSNKLDFMSKVDTLKLRLFEFLVAYDIDNMTAQSKLRCWKVSVCILTNWAWVESYSVLLTISSM